jgi:hypothetical protein
LFLAREDGQPANASLPHELFSLFDVLVLEATNEVGTHVMAHGRRVGVMPVSGGPDGNIAIGHHSHETFALADGNAPRSSERIFCAASLTEASGLTTSTSLTRTRVPGFCRADRPSCCC